MGQPRDIRAPSLALTLDDEADEVGLRELLSPKRRWNFTAGRAGVSGSIPEIDAKDSVVSVSLDAAGFRDSAD